MLRGLSCAERLLRVLLSLVICVVSAMVSLRESEWSLKRTSLSKR